MSELSIAEIITRPGTYVLAVVIFIVTEFIRRVVFVIKPTWKKQAPPAKPYATRMAMIWHTLILYAIPVLLGGLSGLIVTSDFVFGEVQADGRVLLGILIGFLSGYLVKVVKKVIAAKTGVDFEKLSPASATPAGGAPQGDGGDATEPEEG
jgi:hypothetical protein